jgi:hypothetical protein
VDRGVLEICCTPDGRHDDWTRLTSRAVLSHVLLAIEHQVADAKTAALVLTLPLR